MKLAAGHYHISHRIPALIAQRKGLFGEQVNNPQIIATGNDKNTISGLEDNKIQFGLDPQASSVIRAFNEQKKNTVVIIGGWRMQQAHALMAASDIKDINDLKGKKIGIREPKAIGARQIRLLLRKHGIDSGKVEFGKSACSSIRLQVPRMQKGEYDACCISSLDVAQAEKMGYNVLMVFENLYPEGYADRVMCTSKNFLENNYSTVVAFLKGMIRAYRYVRNPVNFDEVQAFIKNCGIEIDEDEDLENWATRFKLPGIVYPLDGRCRKGALEPILKQEIELGNIGHEFDLKNVWAPEPCEEALRELDNEEDNKDLTNIQEAIKKMGYWRKGLEY